MATTETTPPTVASASPWDGFRGALWQREINVRDFIQQNYTPYDGDATFLAPATARTKKIWEQLTTLFVEERKKGVSTFRRSRARSRLMPARISAGRISKSQSDREDKSGLFIVRIENVAGQADCLEGEAREQAALDVAITLV